jgi:hypothetical protein
MEQPESEPQMQIRKAMAGLMLLCVLGDVAPALAARPATRSASQMTAAPTAPVFSPDARWVTALLIIIGALLLAAAVIGPIYCMTVPEALPITHSHDEPPGASHHHGPSGTIDFSIDG